MNIFLIFLGFAAATHLMCTAALLPTSAPMSIALEVSFGFATAVGVVVTAAHGDQERALMFLAALALLLLVFSIEKTLRGKTFLVWVYSKPQREQHRRRNDQQLNKDHNVAT